MYELCDDCMKYSRKRRSVPSALLIADCSDAAVQQLRRAGASMAAHEHHDVGLSPLFHLKPYGDRAEAGVAVVL
eukprot:scaffold68546_cov60-Phaeocystis_antarctica.AAC.2